VDEAGYAHEAPSYGGILVPVTSPLSTIPIDKRRRMAATLGLFAVLLVAIGAVAATGHGSAAFPVFTTVALLLAATLGLIAWGVIRSVQADLAEQRLDAAIEATLAERPEYAKGFASLCSCGHEHDPNELHITDAETADAHVCSHDGAGADCARDCSTCVLTALRSSSLRPNPHATRADRASHGSAG
jgi:hypothetical protein